jgi:hypothetical protein
MNSLDRPAAWAAFVQTFFSSPNEIALTGDDAIETLIARAETAWLASPASPFFLPVVASNWTYWYAICPDREQRLWVSDLIRAHVASWTSFDGMPVSDDSDLSLDQAVRTLVGSRGCSYRLLIPRNNEVEDKVRQSIGRLTRLLADNPHRKVQLTRPLGSLIGDFWDACASGSQALAEELLDLLERDHRLSKANRLFLRLQYLAVFELWDRLEELEQLPDLIRLDRPVLASDALARLAMARLADDAGFAEFAHTTSMFGCLVPSVTSIRSAAGAQYYAYWSLSSGEKASVVAARLLESGWLDHARSRSGMASLLTVHDAPDGVSVTGEGSAALEKALTEGRLDAAIDLLGRIPPSAELLPVLVDLVTKTLSPRSIALLQRWREPLGESQIQAILSGRLVGGGHEVDLAGENFGQTIVRAFADDLSVVDRTRALDNLRAQAVPRLMQAGVLPALVAMVRSLSRSLDPGLLRELIELFLDMERDLFGAGGDVLGIQDLRLLTVEAWALGDESGDRHRAARLLDVVSRVLHAGVSPAVFDEIVENLRAAWTPFLTDADLPLGLEAIEILAARQPDAALTVQAFAMLILSRIGQHNVRRFDAAVLDTAVTLASEFGLELAVMPEADQEFGSGRADRLRPPTGTFVAIYSLMESAAHRAATITARRYPEIRVEALANKVANDALRYAARDADLLVIADKAAAHAATDALKAARGRKPIVYARGKGTASLVEAVVAGLEAICRAAVPEGV